MSPLAGVFSIEKCKILREELIGLTYILATNIAIQQDFIRLKLHAFK